MEFLESFGFSSKWVIGFIVFMIVYVIGIFLFMRNKKQKNNHWLEDNQNASKVFIRNKMGTLVIHSVNNEKVRSFQEGTKSGFYLNPGEHVIESSYQTIRPGVLHKTVTTNYGPSKQMVLAERNKIYEYTFDTDAKQFMFAELGALETLLKGAAEQMKEVKEDASKYAQVYNYIHIDEIDEMQLEAYPYELCKEKKGLLTSKVEVVYVNPGIHTFKVHGTTYQKKPILISANVEEGKYYTLGANEEGAYIVEKVTINALHNLTQ